MSKKGKTKALGTYLLCRHAKKAILILIGLVSLAFSTILPCIKFKTQVASEQKLRNETLDLAA